MEQAQAPGDPGPDMRTRVIEAALKLLNDGGRDAVTTRAVTDAAGIQAPTLYRLFGDKQGLLDAVTDYGYLLAYNEASQRTHDPDPVRSLREGWEFLTRFGLEHPMLFALMLSDLRPGVGSPLLQRVYRLLEGKTHQLAVAGRLKITEKQATDLVYAVSHGVVLALISMPEEQRDLRLSRNACEAVISAITTDATPHGNAGAAAAAIALHASLPQVTSLSAGERLLLSELLQRISVGELTPTRYFPPIARPGLPARGSLQTAAYGSISEGRTLLSYEMHPVPHSKQDRGLSQREWWRLLTEWRWRFARRSYVGVSLRGEQIQPRVKAQLLSGETDPALR